MFHKNWLLVIMLEVQYDSRIDMDSDCLVGRSGEVNAASLQPLSCLLHVYTKNRL